MSGAPYLLAVASHKGGTGRTTAALSLAWALGQAGKRVVLVDADPVHSASMLALNDEGKCTWRNVSFASGIDQIHRNHDADVVVADSPSLMDPLARSVLARVDGIILTCLADPLSIRTVPAAASVIEAIQAQNQRLELLGVLISLYDERDTIQKAMLSRLQQSHKDLLLEPSVPYQTDLCDWPLRPGADPPPGAAREAFARLVTTLDRWWRAA